MKFWRVGQDKKMRALYDFQLLHFQNIIGPSRIYAELIIGLKKAEIYANIASGFGFGNRALNYWIHELDNSFDVYFGILGIWI